MVPDSSPPQVTGDKRHVRSLLLDCGWDRVGFAAATRAHGADHLRDWLERGFAAEMHYMARNVQRRQDPREVLAGARTVIAVGLHHPPPGDESRGPGEPGRARIAAYAQGTDYHRVLERRLRVACDLLAREYPAEYRWYVDTGPVLERDWARAAGIGWTGKNTCAIHPRRGSYFFLGVILTTLHIETDRESTDHCGTCTRCLQACPTDALVAPHRLDSRRCISYLTIEHRGPIPDELAGRFGNLVFGCDICQEVCPYNRRDIAEPNPELARREENIAPSLARLAELTRETFRERFRGSPVLRAKHTGLLRNVIIALGNDASPDSRDILHRLEEREDVRHDPVLLETISQAWRLRSRHDAS